MLPLIHLQSTCCIYKNIQIFLCIFYISNNSQIKGIYNYINVLSCLPSKYTLDIIIPDRTCLDHVYVHKYICICIKSAWY